ncbi:MAG: hypothetical protein K2X32_00760 [Phycisphaerales bacterium]|nr:hypothetical protein [Phycisphaerales bacterium]
MDETPTFRRLSRRFAALEPEREEPDMGSDDRHRALGLAAADAFALFAQKTPPPFPACKTWGEVVREVAIRWPDRLPFPNVVLGRGLEGEPPSELPTETPFIRNSVAVCSLLVELTREPPESTEELLRAEPMRMTERQRLVLLVLAAASEPLKIELLAKRMETRAFQMGLVFKRGDTTELRKRELTPLKSCKWVEAVAGGRSGVRITDAGRAALQRLEKQKVTEAASVVEDGNQVAPAKPS